MGCCESCFNSKPKDYDPGNPRETDPLINSHNGRSPPPSLGETHIQTQTAVPQPKGDEQSALTRILNTTQSNVIDVSAVEGRAIEQHEFHDKARQYRIVADTLIYGTPLANRVDPDETAPTGAVSSGSTLFANTSNHVTISNRVNMVLASSGRGKHYKQPLPSGVAAPTIVLSSQPISVADIDLITSAAGKASQALKSVKVEHKEDLVVPFGVP